MRKLTIVLIGFLLVCFCYYLTAYWLLVLVFFVVSGWGIYQKSLFGLGLLLLGIVLGGGRIYWHETAQMAHLNLNDGVYVELEGKICKEVDYRRNDARYTVCLEWNRQTGEVINGKVLVTLDLYPRFVIGQKLLIKGKAELPKPVEDFRYDLYLKRFGIKYIFYKPQIILLANGEAKHLFESVFAIKDWLIARINRQFHEPFASFLAGLLLGYRGGLSDDLLLGFQRVGLTHIIAISGANIALVVLFLEKILFFLNKKSRFVVLLVCLAGFCLLVGMSASVVRAAIMGGMITMARYFGRDVYIWFVLIFTAVLMTIFVPEILAYDSGFQLSFLALIGIVLIAEKLSLFLAKYVKSKLLEETLAMTLAAQLGTMSLSIFLFKQFSLISILANILVVPLLPIVTLLGGISLLLGDVYGLVGIFEFTVSLILAWIVKIVDLLAGIPYVVLEFSTKSTVVVAVLVSLLMTILMVLFCQFGRKVVVGQDG